MDEDVENARRERYAKVCAVNEVIQYLANVNVSRQPGKEV